MYVCMVKQARLQAIRPSNMPAQIQLQMRSSASTGRFAALAGLLLLLARPAQSQQFSSFFCPAPADSSQQAWPFPVNTSNVCDQLQLNEPNNGVACAALNLLQSLLAGPASSQLMCNIGNQTMQNLWLPKATDKKGQALPQALLDRRAASASSSSRLQLPPVLPATVMDAEGATYNWLYKMLTMFARWSPCEALGTPAIWQLPPGWQLVTLANITGNLTIEGLGANTSLPMLAVLKQHRRHRWWSRGDSRGSSSGGSSSSATDGSRLAATGNHLIILIRGTLTSYERGIDFDYSMEADERYGSGLLHRGFKSAADQLWDSGLQQALDHEVLSCRTSSIMDVTFTGHSLGAGLATLLAARAQKYLAAKRKLHTGPNSGPNRQNRPPLVSAVLFAAPNVGNATFVSDFGQRVNARKVEFAYDMVSQIPCRPQTTACSDSPNPAGAWPYERVGGAVQFTGTDRPFQSDAWQKLDKYTQSDFCASSDSLRWLNQATHLCSYLCRTSMYVSDAENWCLLWPVTSFKDSAGDSQHATHCMAHSGRSEFPTSPIFPSATPS